MRIGLFFGWLLLLPAFWLWHSGPGQARIKNDDAGRAITLADRLIQDGDLGGARQWYEDALKNLPEGSKVEMRRLQLSIAKLDMQDGKLPEAHQALKSLVDEFANDKTTDPKVLADARSSLAQAQYYMTWLMRLEGLPHTEWEPEIDSARQLYRLLTETALASGDKDAAKKHQEDLEAAIRLARMNLEELQGLNLPKQCKGCCSCKGKKPSKKQGQKQVKDARGASGGPPPDNGGH
jgi:tetratricopeptide (TPR) repeat protein